MKSRSTTPSSQLLTIQHSVGAIFYLAMLSSNIVNIVFFVVRLCSYHAVYGIGLTIFYFRRSPWVKSPPGEAPFSVK